MCHRVSREFSTFELSCLRGCFVGPWEFGGSDIFFLWIFCGSKCFFVGISWVQNFFSWLFRGFKIFLVSPKLFLLGISQVQFFFVMAKFVIQRFPVVGCMRVSDKKQQYISTSK